MGASARASTSQVKLRVSADPATAAPAASIGVKVRTNLVRFGKRSRSSVRARPRSLTCRVPAPLGPSASVGRELAGTAGAGWAGGAGGLGRVRPTRARRPLGVGIESRTKLPFLRLQVRQPPPQLGLLPLDGLNVRPTRSGRRCRGARVRVGSRGRRGGWQSRHRGGSPASSRHSTRGSSRVGRGRDDGLPFGARLRHRRSCCSATGPCPPCAARKGHGRRRDSRRRRGQLPDLCRHQLSEDGVVGAFAERELL